MVALFLFIQIDLDVWFDQQKKGKNDKDNYSDDMIYQLCEIDELIQCVFWPVKTTNQVKVTIDDVNV